MPTESSSNDPKLVVGPLALVAGVALWRGIRRKKPFALGVGLVAAITEFASPQYRRFKRRWTILSVTDD